MQINAGTMRSRWLALLVLLIVWAAVFAVRPFTLGFYDDDFEIMLLPTQRSAPWSLERLHFHMELYANRPGTGFATYLASSLANTSAPIWHTIIAAWALLSGLVFRGFLWRLLAALDLPARWPATLGAAAWLAFPWCLGAIAWPTLSPALFALVFYALAGSVVVHAAAQAGASYNLWRPALLAAVLFAASCLTYEMFYGQFVFLALCAYVLTRDPHRRRAFTFRLTLTCFVAQVACIGWNRCVALLVPLAPSKRFNPAWLEQVQRNLPWLERVIVHGAPELGRAIELIWLILVTLALLSWVARMRARQPNALRNMAWLVPGIFFAIATNLAMLSMAGYNLRGRGQYSRSTFGYSFWLAVGLTLTLAWAARLSARSRYRWATYAGAAAMIALLSISTNLRLRDWAQAAQEQDRILAAAPVEQLALLPAGSIVLFDGPYRIHGVNLFGFTYDANSALRYTYPQLAHLRVFPLRPDWRTTWDGTTVVQQLVDAQADPTGRFHQPWLHAAPPGVSLWTYPAGAFLEAPIPFEHPAGVSDPMRCTAWP